MPKKTDQDIITEAIGTFIQESSHLKLIKGGKPLAAQGDTQHPQKEPEADGAIINKALGDENVENRKAILQRSDLTHEHLHKALDDPDEEVRHLAINHRNASHENISKALTDKSKAVRWSALHHPNSNYHHAKMGLNHKSSEIRRAAIDKWGVRFTDDELTTALNDKSQNVQRAARSALRLKSLYREKSKNRKVEECKNPPMSKKTEQEIIDESINSYVGETDDAQDFVLEAKDNITHVVHRNKHIGSIRDNGSNFSLFVVHSGYKDPQFLGVHKTKEDALKELGKFHNIKNPLNGRFSNVH